MNLSSRVASNRMKAVRRTGTQAELALRQALNELGLEYETNARPLPDFNRRADILFREARIAVFVDGCFWHGCPIHGTQAKTNAEFWRKKIEANRSRDQDTNERLAENGWLVIRIWAHESPVASAERIMAELKGRKTG